ncbi:hypothetical protein PUATCC27989T_01073 [Phytobacter ursingii]|nr:hypothetical protein PUATCC27989T_01073 [Phytobacter ursingii]
MGSGKIIMATTKNWAFSPSKLAFYSYALKDLFDAAETWPTDAVDISDDVRDQFRVAPDGKILGSVDGMPAWADIPKPPNSELLKTALQNLTTQYQADIETLNRAWLAAAVSDGTSEGDKKSAVLTQITARKTQYASDRAAVIAQYPV